MHIIRTFAELTQAIEVHPDPQIRSLLATHSDRLTEYAQFDLADLAVFAIVAPEDSLEAITASLSLELIDDAETFILPVEIIALYGSWYEVTFILSDDGFGLVLLVPAFNQTDLKLLVACHRAYAASVESMEP